MAPSAAPVPWALAVRGQLAGGSGPPRLARSSAGAGRAAMTPSAISASKAGAPLMPTPAFGPVLLMLLLAMTGPVKSSACARSAGKSSPPPPPPPPSGRSSPRGSHASARIFRTARAAPDGRRREAGSRHPPAPPPPLPPLPQPQVPPSSPLPLVLLETTLGPAMRSIRSASAASTVAAASPTHGAHCGGECGGL